MKVPIKHPNKSVQTKVILLYFCSHTQKIEYNFGSSAEVEVKIFLSNRVKPLRCGFIMFTYIIKLVQMHYNIISRHKKHATFSRLQYISTLKENISLLKMTLIKHFI